MFPAEIETAQAGRAARQSGSFCRVRKSPQAWPVENGDQEPYDVSQDGDRWTCTCPDYQRFGGEVRGKPFEAIRLTVAEQLNRQGQKEVRAKMDESYTHGTSCGRTKLCHPAGAPVTLPGTPMGVRPQANRVDRSTGSLPCAAGTVGDDRQETRQFRDGHAVRSIRTGGCQPVPEPQGGTDEPESAAPVLPGSK